MASEHSKCDAEPSITDIGEGEMERIGNRTYFVDINDILKREIKEEAKEFKPFNGYGVSSECLENNENGKFYDPNSSELEVTVRDSVEDPTESKFSPVHFWENGNFNGLADELAKQKVNHFHNGVILKNEDPSDCSDDDPITNNIELKTQTLNTEENIDVIYDDVKPEICEEKSSENGSYPNFSHELSKDSKTWPRQNIEEGGTAVEKDNDTRTEPTINTQMIRKKQFQCKFCLKSFSLKGHLTVHERIHTGEKPFQCKMCSKSFNQKAVLTRHERTHTGEKPFQCKFCLKSFSLKGHLTEHERIHTGEKPFQCKMCSKSFNQKGNLTTHEKFHVRENPFQCKICSKSFNQKAVLTRHERIHTVKKPFQCKFCLKSFSLKWYLTGHERIHTGEKPFQCKMCLKSFNQKAVLTRHGRTHTGEKPFQCKFCLKSFSLKGHLMEHERIHTGEKPFQCKTCSKSFNQKGNLSTHEKYHVGKNHYIAKLV